MSCWNNMYVNILTWEEWGMWVSEAVKRPAMLLYSLLWSQVGSPFPLLKLVQSWVCAECGWNKCSICPGKFTQVYMRGGGSMYPQLLFFDVFWRINGLFEDNHKKNFAHFSGFAICLHWSKNVSYHYLCSRMRRSEPDRDAGRVSAGWASVFPEAGSKDLWSSHLKSSKKQHYLVVRPRIQVSLWRWNAVSWATLIWDLVPF